MGYSTAVQEISAKVKARECACEINNPSGRCCLGEVNKVVKREVKIENTGCEFNIENAVKELNGIIQAKADYQKREVYVKFEKGELTIDKIIQAINKIGYKAYKPDKSLKERR